MSSHANEPDEDRSVDPDQDEPVGVEIGQTEGEGSTFEPEEDPEGHAG